MKTGSVLALCPGFFATAPAGSYSSDLSERDRNGPDAGVTGKRIRDGMEHRGDGGGACGRGGAGASDWVPPGRDGEAIRALEGEGEAGLVHHHEAFFNGSLILTTEEDKFARGTALPAAA